MTIFVKAPFEGWVFPIEATPDQAFADKVLGNGIVIDPLGAQVLAPISGEIISIAQTRHALTIKHKSGLELLIHVGIDSVALKGQGFECLCKLGQNVSVGEPLLSFDPHFLSKYVKSLMTPLIVLNSEAFDVIPLSQNSSVTPSEDVIRVEPKNAKPLTSVSHAAELDTDYEVSSIKLNITNGIHARPAAQIVECVKPFKAKVEIGMGSRFVSASSISALMLLGAKQGDNINIRAIGPDAKAAIAALKDYLDFEVDTQSDSPNDNAQKRSENISKNYISGVGVGTALLAGPVWRWDNDLDFRDYETRNSDFELRAFEKALKASRDDVKEKSLGEGAYVSIKKAHLQILEDPIFLEDIRSHISKGKNAPIAVQFAVKNMTSQFAQADSVLLRERGADFKDVGRIIIEHLIGKARAEIKSLKDKIVLVEDITPSDVIKLGDAGALAICVQNSGATSHAAIVAASIGLPMIVACGAQLKDVEGGTFALFDASSGQLNHRPSKAQRARHEARGKAQKKRFRAADKFRSQTAILKSGEQIKVYANLGSVSDATTAIESGAEGCGLLRTEFLFQNWTSPPSMEEQRILYQEIADKMDGRPLIIRTLDVGADKPMAFMPLTREDNPALGVRGVRLSLQNPAFFEDQIEACCRIVSKNPVHLMVPMINNCQEIKSVRDIFSKVLSALDLDQPPSLGIMIETPAAALMADKLIQYADFFSIGSNDLSQYCLAMDRLNPNLAPQIEALSPSVLRLIASTTKAAIDDKKWVGVCGAMASDILSIPVLIGLGVTELSATADRIPIVKSIIRELDFTTCETLAWQALEQESASDVQNLIRKAAPSLAEIS